MVQLLRGSSQGLTDIGHYIQGINLVALCYLECGTPFYDWRYMYVHICIIIG